MQVSEADAHVVMEGVGDADGEAEAEESLDNAKHVEIPHAQEKRAGDCTPDDGGGGECKIRQMRGGKQDGGEAHGRDLARKESQEAGQEVVLQEELLVDGPENVGGDVRGVGVAERMQRADLAGEQHAENRHSNGDGKNPARGEQASAAEAQFVEGGAAEQYNSERGDECDGTQDCLGTLGEPDDQHDKAIAKEDFGKIASGAGRGSGHQGSMA